MELLFEIWNVEVPIREVTTDWMLIACGAFFTIAAAVWLVTGIVITRQNIKDLERQIEERP